MQTPWNQLIERLDGARIHESQNTIMIYIEQKQIAIITPPHTASGNLHRALCTEKHGGRWVIGPTLGNSAVSHHYAEIPVGWLHDGCKVYCIWRNPYDRLRGLYRHLIWWENKTNGDQCNLSWTTFIEKVASDDQTLYWIYRWTIKRLIGKTYVHAYVDYDNLQQNISGLLKCKVKLPKRNTPQYEQPVLGWFNQEEQNIISKWCQEDLSLFNEHLHQSL